LKYFIFILVIVTACSNGSGSSSLHKPKDYQATDADNNNFKIYSKGQTKEPQLGLVKLPHYLYFEFSNVKLCWVHTWYYDRELEELSSVCYDSTSFEFDQEGRMINTVDIGRSGWCYQNKFTFDNKDRVDTQYSGLRNNNQGFNFQNNYTDSSRLEILKNESLEYYYIYNENGDVKEYQAHDWNKNHDSIIRFGVNWKKEFDQNNNVTSFQLYDQSNEVIFSEVYTFGNSNELLTSKMTYPTTEVNDERSILFDSKAHKIYPFKFLNRSICLETTYEYNPTEASIISNTSNLIGDESKTIYYFDHYGNEIKTETYINDSLKSTIQNELVYDQYGNPTLQKNYKDGILIELQKFTYEYLEQQ
jgi:hypothetical protein